LTQGLSWTSDYVALYNENEATIDMQGWVTLRNRSGTTFHQANTVLVSGDPSEESIQNYGARGARSIDRAGTQTPDRERLGDFYLYPIQGRTTLANAQTKQVSFLDVQSVPAKKVYQTFVEWRQNDENPRNVQSAIKFSTSRDQGLGDALPSGTVRFYQRDSQGVPQFIGENGISHTPMGSELSLETGDAFDIMIQSIVARRSQISAQQFEQSSRFQVLDENDERVEQANRESIRNPKYYRTTMLHTLTNAKDEPVEVELIHTGLGRYWWGADFRVVKEDEAGEQIDYSRRKYTITVPANGERQFRVTFDTRF
jgi:hypothetical protein